MAKQVIDKIKRLLANMGQFKFLSQKVMKKYINRWLTFKVVNNYWLTDWGRQDGVFGPDDDIWLKGLFRGMTWSYKQPEKPSWHNDREIALAFERVRFLVVDRMTGERKVIKIPRFFRCFPVSLLELNKVKALPEKTRKALGLICAE